jgi:AbrB family looped-hinge helix DNA binding protein
MKLTKVTSNGRVTIPAELREEYNLNPGRRVKFETTEDGIRIILLATPEEIYPVRLKSQKK